MLWDLRLRPAPTGSDPNSDPLRPELRDSPLGGRDNFTELFTGAFHLANSSYGPNLSARWRVCP